MSKKLRNAMIIVAATLTLGVATGGAFMMGHLQAREDQARQEAAAIEVPVVSADAAEEHVAPSGERVSRAQASDIALAWVGEGRVTGSEHEDDHGAAWEIEITRPDGSEIDVYVAANGEVLND